MVVLYWLCECVVISVISWLLCSVWVCWIGVLVGSVCVMKFVLFVGVSYLWLCDVMCR